MDSFSKEIMPRAETAHCEVAVMAASTKAARRLGPDDMANASEVLINLVSGRQAKGAETRRGEKRLAQKGCGPLETLLSRFDTPVRPLGERNCLSRPAWIGKWNWVARCSPQNVETEP
jgi:hypothetical protein